MLQQQFISQNEVVVKWEMPWVVTKELKVQT